MFMALLKATPKATTKAVAKRQHLLSQKQILVSVLKSTVRFPNRLRS